MFAIPAGVGATPASPYVQPTSQTSLDDRRVELSSIVDDATGAVPVATKAKAQTALNLLQFNQALTAGPPAVGLEADTISLSQDAARLLSPSRLNENHPHPSNAGAGTVVSVRV